MKNLTKGKTAARVIQRLMMAALGLSIYGMAAPPVAKVTIHIRRPGARIPPGFVGFSNEVSTAGMGLPTPTAEAQGGIQRPAGVPAKAQLTYVLGEPGAPNLGVYKMMRNLGPGLLRLGGNSQDNTCWDEKAAPHPAWCHGAITRGMLKLYATAAADSGWRLIVGLNLKQNAPRWALREVTQGIAKEIPASKVYGLELGNEPSLYIRTPARPKNYSPADYVHDARGYIRALRANPIARRYGLVAPADCCQWNNPASLDVILKGLGRELKLVSIHNYTTTVCGHKNATATELLSRRRMERFDRLSRQLAAVARRHHLPIALAETNSASCGGMAGVSNAFAAAAWGLDYMFNVARDGYQAINFHFSYRKDSGSAYNPIQSFGWKAGNQEQYRNIAQPLYYAMYMFARHASGERFLADRIQTSANINSFATTACRKCAMHVFVINEDARAAGTVEVHFSGNTAGKAGTAELLLLRAPSLHATAAGVRYGGQQFNSNGKIGRPQTRRIRPDQRGDYRFRLPNAAIAMLTLRR